jgi:hypothetical protein
MNLGKLTKRLRKELLAHPKQAAVLAIVCLVACWFWSPLLLKWFSGNAAVATAPLKADLTVSSNQVAATNEEQKHSWIEIHRWREADPLAHPFSLPAGSRDPFESRKPAIADQVADQAKTKNPEPTVENVPLRPDGLGLKLEAIVYGGSRRLAQINGQTVKENDEVTLAGETKQAAGPKIVGRVLEIRSNEVLLDFSGYPILLSLQPKVLGRGEVVQRAKTQ